MKIGMYTPSYPSVSGEGGIGTYVRENARALSEAGHEVHVLTPGSGPAIQDGLVRVHQYTVAPLRGVDRIFPGAGANWRAGREMTRLVRQYQLDVVEFPNWEGLSLYFAWRRSVPLVIRLSTSSAESIQIDQLPMNRQLAYDVRRERWSARSADVLVTHSEAHRERMASELQVDAAEIRVVAHGITPSGESGLPVPRDAMTVVYLGRLERRKGTADLLDAVPAVLERYPGARFVLIGADRPHCQGGRTHARYLADEFSPTVQRAVTLTGRLSDADVEEWLRRATIFVAPSLYESFGLVFLEAMRWGTPVIGTRAGGIPEIVEDGVTGLLVPPGNPALLAASIINLLGSPTRRQMLGDAGRVRVEGVFSSEEVARRMAALYGDLIEQWRG